MAHITRLQIRNFMRISALDIVLNGGVNVIAGKNGAGKTCLLKALQALLEGKTAFDEKHDRVTKPIKNGEDRAELIGEIAELDLIIKRVYTPSGERLSLTDFAGRPYPKPQEKLSQLLKARAYNPIAFAQGDGAKQTKMLMELGGLDLSDLDEAHGQLYEERRTVNRKLRDAEGALTELPKHEDAPGVEVSIAELLEEQDRRKVEQAANNEKREAVGKAWNTVDGLQRQATSLVDEIRGAEAALDVLCHQLKETRTSYQKQLEQTEQLDAASHALTDPDLDDIKQQLSTVEDTNRKVRANTTRTEHKVKVHKLQEQGNALTVELYANRAARQKRITAADFPVEGLGFGDDGPTLHGIPLHQASHRQQTEISVAVMAAANPDLAVFLIPDASTLDEDGQRLVAELAEKYKCQVVEEDWRTDDPAAIFLEDGMVKGSKAAEESAA